MTKRLEIYKCEVCGNMIEMIHAGAGELVCCNQPMKHYDENTTDAATEKHVPVYKSEGHTLHVKVGEIAHPMETKHYIEWIEVVDGNKAYCTFLKPGDKPEAHFEGFGAGVTVREYCNVHGLWKGGN